MASSKTTFRDLSPDVMLLVFSFLNLEDRTKCATLLPKLSSPILTIKDGLKYDYLTFCRLAHLPPPKEHDYSFSLKSILDGRFKNLAIHRVLELSFSGLKELTMLNLRLVVSSLTQFTNVTRINLCFDTQDECVVIEAVQQLTASNTMCRLKVLQVDCGKRCDLIKKCVENLDGKNLGKNLTTIYLSASLSRVTFLYLNRNYLCFNNEMLNMSVYDTYHRFKNIKYIEVINHFAQRKEQLFIDIKRIRAELPRNKCVTLKYQLRTY